jgi:RNA-directed DNA polymerase
MKDGEFSAIEEGSPQGGVISPLISNIYLNVFDQKMRDKDIRIVRYADDILIFARTEIEAKNYLALATRILEEEMKLTVNREKTCLSSLSKGVLFLGVVIRTNSIGVNPKRLKRFKDKIRSITRRNAGRKLICVIKELNMTTRGWINYYKIADIKGLRTELMKWIRRRLRMVIMKQWKTYKPMHKLMRRKGFEPKDKLDVTKWKNSKVQIIHLLLPNSDFDELGLYDLESVEVGLLSPRAIKVA